MVFLLFAQRCWQSVILKFASYSVCTSTEFLCWRIGSHSQHCSENLVMYVKDDAVAGSAY